MRKKCGGAVGDTTPPLTPAKGEKSRRGVDGHEVIGRGARRYPRKTKPPLRLPKSPPHESRMRSAKLEESASVLFGSVYEPLDATRHQVRDFLELGGFKPKVFAASNVFAFMGAVKDAAAFIVKEPEILYFAALQWVVSSRWWYGRSSCSALPNSTRNSSTSMRSSNRTSHPNPPGKTRLIGICSLITSNGSSWAASSSGKKQKKWGAALKAAPLISASLLQRQPGGLGRGCPATRQLQPLVWPQVSHLRQVPFRTSVKLPHSVQLSPS